MPRKTKIIFIVVFIIVGAVMLGVYYANQSGSGASGSGSGSGYNIFNPFSTNSPNSNGVAGGDGSDSGYVETPIDDTTPNLTTQRLYKITDFAVAGATFFEDSRPLPVAEAVVIPEEAPIATAKKPVEKPAEPKFEIVPALRYVEKVTGHIYHMYLDTKIESKISNSTIPSIHEAIFDSSAKTLIYRYLNESKIITSFMATLGSSKGEFLPSNILEVSLSPDETKFFYLTKTSNGVVGNIRSFSETKKSQIFTSPFSEWLPQWATNQKIFLTTKPSVSVEGSLFALNTANGALSKIFGGVRGLTTLANGSGTSVLYSSATSLGPQLGLLNVDNHSTDEIDVYTLPEKCIWGVDSTAIYCAVPKNLSGSQYPDSWYQGLVSFDDSFIKIDTTTLKTTTIDDGFSAESIDATHLFLDKTESNLFFINKKDGSLWGLSLN